MKERSDVGAGVGILIMMLFGFWAYTGILIGFFHSFIAWFGSAFFWMIVYVAIDMISPTVLRKKKVKK